jgi:hypothetical protein
LKNSKVVLFLSLYKVGQDGNFWTPLSYITFCVRFEVGSADAEDSDFWVVKVSGMVTDSSCFKSRIFPQIVWNQQGCFSA